MQNFLYNVLENSVSVAALELLNVNKLIPLDDGNKLSRYLKMGAIWTLADELVLMLRTGTSHIAEGHVYFLLDSVFLNSALYGAITETGVDNMVLDVAETLPIPAEYQGVVASGILKVGVKTVAEIIQTNYQNTPLGYLTNPTQLLIPQSQ